MRSCGAAITALFGTEKPNCCTAIGWGLPVGGEVGDRIAAVGQAQAGANQAMKGLLEFAVGHPRAAKGDAAHISIWVLDGCPGSTCKSP